MSSAILPSVRGARGPAVAFSGALAFLAGCAAPPPPAAVQDPYETGNRRIHAVNLAVDRAILSPAANGYSSILPEPLRKGVDNFAGNLDLPGEAVNHLLQVRPHLAIEDTLRFAINSTIGIGGLFDPATALGLPRRGTDFGETLHVWGMEEGNYVELPLLGPSTDRDALGEVVDIAMNPVRVAIPKEQAWISTAAKGLSILGDRARYSGTVDSILYESADSYAQARILYLQNRRYELGQTAGDDAFFDPYEDPYAE